MTSLTEALDAAAEALDAARLKSLLRRGSICASDLPGTSEKCELGRAGAPPNEAVSKPRPLLSRTALRRSPRRSSRGMGAALFLLCTDPARDELRE